MSRVTGRGMPPYAGWASVLPVASVQDILARGAEKIRPRARRHPGPSLFIAARGAVKASTPVRILPVLGSREHRSSLPDQPFDQIKIGETVYPLRQSVMGETETRGDGDGEIVFRVRAFGPVFEGRGPDLAGAVRGWREQVHAAFQKLHGRLAFEMSEADRARWADLSRVIDVERYERGNPLRVREFGRVARALPYEVVWEGGQPEPISLEQAPQEFAKFEPDQWFEATVVRNPLTWALVRIVEVRSCESPAPLTEADMDAYCDGMATMADLPASTVRWKAGDKIGKTGDAP